MNSSANWIDPLIKEYYTWLQKQTKIFTDSKSEWITIRTPYIGLFNDIIEMYAKQNGDKIILSDNGDTLSNLELAGTTFTRSNTKKSLLESVLLNYGIKLQNDELIIETSSKDFSQNKHNFISAIMELNDFYTLSKQNIYSVFKDEVKKYLDIKNVIYTPSFISKGSTGLEFMFDFQIASRTSEIVIKSFNTVNKQNLTNFLFSWDDIKPIREKISSKELVSVAIINDDDKELKSEYEDALLSKGVNLLRWSKREESESMNLLHPSNINLNLN